MDNIYDNKRNNDRNYSDLFDQCMGSGGRKHSPYRKKDAEIQPKVGVVWSDPEVKHQIRRDYAGYNARQMMVNEYRSSIGAHLA